MVLNGFCTVFGVAFVGGLSGVLLEYYKIRKFPTARIPEYFKFPLKNFHFWLATILMAIIGGFIAVLYGKNNMNPILVYHLGVSAPIILEKFSTGEPRLMSNLLQKAGNFAPSE